MGRSPTRKIRCNNILHFFGNSRRKQSLLGYRILVPARAKRLGLASAASCRSSALPISEALVAVSTSGSAGAPGEGSLRIGSSWS
ncbi:hypothetical protein ACQKWADRAFT_280437 [Trichoderma austrokoningii]